MCNNARMVLTHKLTLMIIFCKGYATLMLIITWGTGATIFGSNIDNHHISYLISLTPPLRWRHNDHPGVSNHQPHGCLLNRLFRRKSKKTSKLRVTGLCAGNSPGTGEFPAQMASYAENVSIWWRHHDETHMENLIMKQCVRLKHREKNHKATKFGSYKRNQFWCLNWLVTSTWIGKLWAS